MKKRIGIILDSLFVSKQIKDLIEFSNKSNHYKITTLIINELDKNKGNLASKVFSYIGRRGMSKFLSTAFFKAICKIEKILQFFNI